MQQKKIAIVSEFFYPSIGGQEKRLWDIANILSEKDIVIDVYTIRYSDELCKKEQIGNINIFRIVDDFQYKNGGGLKSRSIYSILKYSMMTVKKLKKSNNIYEKIIYSEFPILHLVLSKLFFIKYKKILDFVEYRESKFWEIVFKIEMFSADKIVCISNEVKRKVEKISNAKKVVAIPSSVKIEKYFHREAKYFIFIGRMERHKHPENAIQIVNNYNRLYQEKQSLYLIGGGTLHEELKEKYKNEKHIKFCGVVSEKEKITILSMASVLIFPSEREGLPITVIEAMSSGVPTLTSNYKNNGTKNFVMDEKIGLVAEPNIEDMTNKLKSIMNDHHQFLQTCLERSRHYNVDETANKFWGI